MRTLRQIAFASAVAAACGLFGWQAVIIAIPAILGIAFLVARLFNASTKYFAYRGLMRMSSEYGLAADGRFAQRDHRGIPLLLLELGIGARERLRVASPEPGDHGCVTVPMPRRGRRIAA